MGNLLCNNASAHIGKETRKHIILYNLSKIGIQVEEGQCIKWNKEDDNEVTRTLHIRANLRFQ